MRHWQLLAIPLVIGPHFDYAQNKFIGNHQDDSLDNPANSQKKCAGSSSVQVTELSGVDAELSLVEIEIKADSQHNSV